MGGLVSEGHGGRSQVDWSVVGLGVTNMCCLGQFLTSLQLLLEIKTEIEVEMLIVVLTKLVSRT